MCLVFNKKRKSLALIFSILLFYGSFFSINAFGFGILTVIGSGKDLQESMRSALHQAVMGSLNKNKGIDRALLKSILENEVYNSTSQFISSYKILEGGAASGAVNISAAVEVDVVRALLAIVPENFVTTSKD